MKHLAAVIYGLFFIAFFAVCSVVWAEKTLVINNLQLKIEHNTPRLYFNIQNNSSNVVDVSARVEIKDQLTGSSAEIFRGNC